MQVKNYYQYTMPELDKAIHDMREWLWNFQKHEQRARVGFALEVALNAKETFEARQQDPWIQEVLDILC